MKVIKRDGTEEEFNKYKIIKALEKAFIEIDNVLTEESLSKICTIANSIEKKNKVLKVEDIQDIIEEKLMVSNRKDVAKVYILYRAERTRHRERNNKMMKEIGEKLKATNVQNQNANVDEKSFGGRIGEASETLLKKIALEEYVSDMAKENHLNNEIYIHDLSHYVIGSHNCLSVPFDKLLANGFNTRQTDVRPANSVNTAFQLVAVIFQLQSLQQFGGVTATHLDWTMVPYVRKSFFKHWKNGHKYILQNGYADELVFLDDKSINDDYYKDSAYQYAIDMTVKETYQAVEGMYHNLKIWVAK